MEYLLGKPGESCDFVCQSNNLMCASSGHNLTEQALSIIQSMGLTCSISPDSQVYKDGDNPALTLGTKQLYNMCSGFYNIPKVIDCGAGGNSSKKRLCPCIKTTGMNSINYMLLE